MLLFQRGRGKKRTIDYEDEDDSDDAMFATGSRRKKRSRVGQIDVS